MVSNKIPPIYVCGTQEENNIRGSFITENHPYHLFILCTAGKGSIITEQIQEKDIRPDTLIYIGPAVFSAVRPLSGDLSLRFISFAGSVASDLVEYCRIDMTGVISGLPAELTDDFNALYGAGHSDKSGTTVGIYKFITKLCSRRVSRAVKARPYRDYIRSSFEEFVVHNLSAGINIDDFCKDPGISATELDDILDMGIDETVKSCRIKEAKRLLITRPSDRRETICRYCGFSEPDELEQEFFKREGCSVDEFIMSYIPDTKRRLS